MNVLIATIHVSQFRAMEKQAKIESISLQGALDIIWYSNTEFSLEFATVKGYRSFKPRVRLGSEGIVRSDKSDRKHHHIKYHQNLMLFNVEQGKTFECKIPLLLKINGIKIKHWND